MDEQTEKLKLLIEASQRILVTSHISPDPDAVASLLLVGTALKTNFSDKNIVMVLEEEPIDLDFLAGYKEIRFESFQKTLESTKPQLVIILDGNNYSRSSRLDGDAVRQYIKQNGVKTAIIDHHEQADKEDSDVFINRAQPATAQTVYEVFFKEMQLKRPDGAIQTAMAGFYADTGGFAYLKAGAQAKAFDFAEELVEAGANVESIKNELSRYSEADMRVLSELTANVSHNEDYTFSFIRDSFLDGWLKEGNSQARLQKATGIFLDEFIRNIDGRQWGFIVYKNTLQGKGIYSASFRAAGDTRDVAAIANTLGGGGHKPAAGAKFEAGSLEDALRKVKSAITQA